ncbi:acyltransferase family protein [Streptomyces sp. NPDC057927]
MTHPGPLPSLTGLRWVAALLVFCLHTRNLGYFNGQARHFADWGFGAGSTGVSFFFLLSGFVLGWSARSDDRPTAFWRRRFARLYPVHLVTACIAVFVMGMGKPAGSAAIRACPSLETAMTPRPNRPSRTAGRRCHTR